MAPNILYDQIVAALAVVRAARFDGHIELIDGCERHLNALLDRLPVAVPA